MTHVWLNAVRQNDKKLAKKYPKLFRFSVKNRSCPIEQIELFTQQPLTEDFINLVKSFGNYSAGENDLHNGDYSLGPINVKIRENAPALITIRPSDAALNLSQIKAWVEFIVGATKEITVASVEYKLDDTFPPSSFVNNTWALGFSMVDELCNDKTLVLKHVKNHQLLTVRESSFDSWRHPRGRGTTISFVQEYGGLWQITLDEFFVSLHKVNPFDQVLEIWEHSLYNAIYYKRLLGLDRKAWFKVCRKHEDHEFKACPNYHKPWFREYYGLDSNDPGSIVKLLTSLDPDQQNEVFHSMKESRVGHVLGGKFSDNMISWLREKEGLYYVTTGKSETIQRLVKNILYSSPESIVS